MYIYVLYICMYMNRYIDKDVYIYMYMYIYTHTHI